MPITATLEGQPQPLRVLSGRIAAGLEDGDNAVSLSVRGELSASTIDQIVTIRLNASDLVSYVVQRLEYDETTDETRVTARQNVDEPALLSRAIRSLPATLTALLLIGTGPLADYRIRAELLAGGARLSEEEYVGLLVAEFDEPSVLTTLGSLQRQLQSQLMFIRQDGLVDSVLRPPDTTHVVGRPLKGTRKVITGDATGDIQDVFARLVRQYSFRYTAEQGGEHVYGSGVLLDNNAFESLALGLDALIVRCTQDFIDSEVTSLKLPLSPDVQPADAVSLARGLPGRRVSGITHQVVAEESTTLALKTTYPGGLAAYVRDLVSPPDLTLTAIAQGDTITLDATHDGATPIERYRVIADVVIEAGRSERVYTHDVDALLARADGQPGENFVALPVVYEGVTSGLLYQFTVRAENSAGVGDYAFTSVTP